MTAYLYVLSIGPVQDFIAAARRTRDLWFGSHLLSEISKAAAKQIMDERGNLIFPSPKDPGVDLEPSDKRDAFNVANIILAELEVQDVKDIEPLDKNAKKAATDRWKEYAGKAKREADKVIDETIWEEQVEDVIEFYSAWVPFQKKTYASDRVQLMRLLAARKSTRNFEQPNGNHPGIDKSSLDGARETVLKKDKDIPGKQFPKDLALRMRRSKGEQLCAVGVTKRLGGGPVPFPSVVRVALDPWIRGVQRDENAKKILDEIGEKCRGETSFSSRTGGTLYNNFPYDGQVLFRSRLPVLMETSRELAEIEPFKEDREKLTRIKELVGTLQKSGYGEPNPYFAILVADGDQMGKAISHIDDPGDHRRFSAKLSEFAQSARDIVEKDYCGCMVYSGGDDVLAFLPVDTCIAAARKLHDSFGEILRDYPKKGEPSPTLSVGIAIGHTRDPLEDLRNYGKAAEEDAKEPDRNGLAIHLHTRSGGDPIRIRKRWREKGKRGLDERMEKWVKMYLDDTFPDKAAYELRQLAEVYRGWEHPPDPLHIQKDVRRLLARKRPGEGSSAIKEQDIKYLEEEALSYDCLCRLAEELVLARRIAENQRQALGKTLPGRTQP